ncbi:MAG: chromate resistance protein ChrB domain-containing protein [Paracoccaceae bacterium]
MASPNEITPLQLMRLIGTPAAPAIVDVFTDTDFSDDPHLIPTSFRHPHSDLPGLVTRLGDRSALIACQKGKKLSQGVAAYLRTEGIAAEYLQGGLYGWRDAGGPLIPAKILPDPVNNATLWVTRHRPKIDRIACPWLIRRFVDPDARFLFVAPSEVLNVADRFGATPFDVEGVFWSHRGDTCTFDTMLTEFMLENEALLRLASVVRGADTNRHDLAPEAAGLLAISVGLSRQYKDDTAQLDAGMVLYDALYRWARDGFDEGHDWPNNQGHTK